uniref:Uncharacterized protein n=1 Tax=Arundo donax TaxID=35708 RepID=A0A0A9GJP9_ARUDO
MPLLKQLLIGMSTSSRRSHCACQRKELSTRASTQNDSRHMVCISIIFSGGLCLNMKSLHTGIRGKHTLCGSSNSTTKAPIHQRFLFLDAPHIQSFHQPLTPRALPRSSHWMSVCAPIQW